MSTGYQITDPGQTYFLTFQVIDWIDIFSRQVYRDIVIDNMKYCREQKGLEIWAYVIMTNHIHCIWSAKNRNLPSVIRDFKSYTAKTILDAIHDRHESRRVWMLNRFESTAKQSTRNSKFQFWTHENHAVELMTNNFLLQKLAYIHENPVKAGFVESASDWLYSSQRNYSGLEAVMEIDMMDV